MLEKFVSIFVVYFVVIDPIGTVPLFVALTANLSVRAKLRLALEGAFIAGLILIFFAVFGAELLTYLGISLIAFKIGGGILLFRLAIEMLSSERLKRKQKTVTDVPLTDKKQGESEAQETYSVYPLAIPLLAGPASIVSVMVITSDTVTKPELHIIGMTALVITLVLTSLILCFVAVLGQFINARITDVISRVMAILLAALSVQYVLDGLAQTGLLTLP